MPVPDRVFGMSTCLFRSQRLTREHLVHVAAHGFDAIELVSSSHVDTTAAGLSELSEWLLDTRLALHSVHLERAAALDDTLHIATVIPYRYLVMHPEPQPDAARRSIEAAVSRAAAHDVKVAVEVMPSGRWNTGALTRLVEEALEDVDVGICFDFGHAHLGGDIGEAIELVSGHLVTTHIHDNRGRTDEHLVPFSGTIDWDLAMMETQKIGYDGVLLFELAEAADPVETLRRAAKARERLEKAFVTF